MGLSLLDRALWAVGSFSQAALLLVLLVKGRWRTFPIFTLWIGFITFKDTLLYYVYGHSSPGLYKIVYWSAAIFDLALQTALVFEIARVVLKPTGTWVRDAYRFFLLWGSAGALLAIGLAFAVDPTWPRSLNSWISHANLFAGLLICELFVSMMLASTRLGLVWKNHVMGLGRGLTAWILIGLIADAAKNYMGPDWYAYTLDHLRVFSYLGAILYWAVIFWSPEPESRKLSPEMQKYIFTLHQQVNLGLRSVSSSKQQS